MKYFVEVDSKDEDVYERMGPYSRKRTADAIARLKALTLAEEYGSLAMYMRPDYEVLVRKEWKPRNSCCTVSLAVSVFK